MQHILQFSSSEDTPIMLLREKGEITSRPLKGEQNFSFSPIKACVGYKKMGEKWEKCTHGSLNVRQCPQCQFKDIARCYTVGDFSLYPELKEELDSHKYIIYLAQFGEDITKVGLTRRSRYMQRWREQGADFAIALLEFDGPDQAYPAEQFISYKFHFTSAVRASQKIKRINFDSKKAKEKLQQAADEVLCAPQTEQFRTDEKIVDLSEFYPKIKSLEKSDFVGGKILGAKGQWLFYENPSGQHYASNINSQISRFLQERENSGDLFRQAGL